MDTQKNKDLYVKRKYETLQKLDNVIEKLIIKAGNALPKESITLNHMAIILRIKKTRTAIKLRQLEAGSLEKWGVLSNSLEISLKDLSKAFSKAMRISS